MCNMNSNKKRIMFSRVSERIPVLNFRAHTCLLVSPFSSLLSPLERTLCDQNPFLYFRKPCQCSCRLYNLRRSVKCREPSCINDKTSQTYHMHVFNMSEKCISHSIFGGAGGTTGCRTGVGAGACVVTCALVRPSRYHVHAPYTVAKL